MIDVSEAVRAGGVVGFRDGIAEIGDFIGLKAIGDAHFVEISIAGEGQKAGVLVFPAETADSGLTRRFDDGNIKHLATNLVVAFLALVLGEVDKSLIGDGFHKSIAENVEGNAEGANLFRVRNALLNFGAGEGGIRANGAVVDERATFDDFGSTSNGDFGIYELPVGTAVTHAQFADLAGAAGSGILVALAAGLRVVKRAEAVGDLLDFIELDLIGGMGGVVHETVGLIVETGGRFRKRRSEREKGDGQQGQADENLHWHLNGRAERIYMQTPGMPSQKNTKGRQFAGGCSLDELR